MFPKYGGVGGGRDAGVLNPGSICFRVSGVAFDTSWQVTGRRCHRQEPANHMTGR